MSLTNSAARPSCESVPDAVSEVAPAPLATTSVVAPVVAEAHHTRRLHP